MAAITVNLARHHISMFDIIGDIHGHADELVELLTKLGYSEQSGCFRHPRRRVIFCGDFVDRGPHIPDVVRIARSMAEGKSALAVMGNHEFNALAYNTPDPAAPGRFLRAHSKQNEQQHIQTLRQFTERELAAALDWFRTLPPALDLGNLRVVHACWDPAGIGKINDALSSDGQFTPAFLKRATAPGTPLFEAVECVMKGPELALPDGVTVTDKEGNVRRRIRIRWYDEPAGETWASYGLPAQSFLPMKPVPADAPAVPYSADEPPVFVGHYWLPHAAPAPLRPNIACLDYSVAKFGFLCAYRFDGELSLLADRFVTVPAKDTRP
ncbi:MAG: metallophosphoesterase [Fuerstiella sp.]|jgi:hypothetical protein|nr:metallophosphoesterase [Fuerstiella sp.]